MMKKQFISICSFTLLLLVAAGCNPNEMGQSYKGVSIRPVVSTVVETKSGAASEQLFDSFVIDTIGGQEIKLDAYVSDYDPEACGEETKGAITTKDNITEFWMNAYAHDAWHDNGTGTDHIAGQYFDTIKIVSKKNSTWSIADSPKWLNNVDMSFWSWAGEAKSSSTPAVPADGLKPASVNTTNNTASISYTTNGQLDLVYAFNKEKRAFDEKTGEITGGSGTYKTGSKDGMDITFHHALSAVRFDISGLKENGLKIKKVTFKGVVNQATCVITADITKTGNPLTFAWTPKTVTAPETNKADLSMEYVSTDFTEKDIENKSIENSLMPKTSGKFLFFIPQEVQGKRITVELVYEDESGTTQTKSASLDHSTAWEAGKYYTYRLSVKKGLSVTVDDDLEDNVKDNLSILYEGDKSAYIRALIVAYWVDASGNYLSNCDYNSQGTLVGLATGNWVKDTTDGFFYYNAEVVSGTDVGPSLLTSYTAPTPPINGAILRMVIAAQATEYDSSKTCYEAFNSNNTTK